MAAAKAGLKAAKAALDAHKYEASISEAEKVIALDPKSYNA